MATAVQKISLSSSRDIPFNKLTVSQTNVRALEQLMAFTVSNDHARRILEAVREGAGAQADIALIISTALPKGVETFDLIDKVYMTVRSQS